MLDLNESYVSVIEDFIPAEEAKQLGHHIVENSEEDRRDYYRMMPLGKADRVMVEGGFKWDTNNYIKKAADYAFSEFKKRYDLDDSFVLDRAFGNIMMENAQLDSHMDFSYDESSEHDSSKKTFVAGLFLSDDYEGGTMTFYEPGVLRANPKAGTLILFNGHSIQHGVEKITKGTRVNILYMFYYSDTNSVQS